MCNESRRRSVDLVRAHRATRLAFRRIEPGVLRVDAGEKAFDTITKRAPESRRSLRPLWIDTALCGSFNAGSLRLPLKIARVKIDTRPACTLTERMFAAEGVDVRTIQRYRGVMTSTLPSRRNAL